MKLLDGKKIAAEIRAQVKEDVKKLGFSPGLAAILVGDDTASKLYVSLKQKACAEAGIRFEKFEFDAQSSLKKIAAKIRTLNVRADIDGILIQLPLPKNFNSATMIRIMVAKKDVDGFLPGSPVTPPTVRGIGLLLESTDANLKNKKAAIVANSGLFKKAIVDELVRHELVVTDTLAEADVVVTATGRPSSLRAGDVPAAQIIIDVGSPLPDADVPSFQNRDIWITPVPGGVGPMTVACLLQNVVALSQLAKQ